MAYRSQLPNGVVDLHVYESVYPGVYSLSALAVTCDGEVYGLGVNTLVTGENYTSARAKPFPMVENAGEFLKDWVKVEKLCGLGIRKIVVGLGSGAAVTNDKTILTWGDGPATWLQNLTVMVQEHDPRAECRFCRDTHLCGEQVGTLRISYCPIKNRYSLYDHGETPPDNVRVRRIVPGFNIVVCSRCMVMSSGMSLPRGRRDALNSCDECKRLWTVEDNTFLLGELTGSFFRKLEYPGGFKDVAPGGWGFWCLTEANSLLWSGYFTHADSPDAPNWWKTPLVAPEEVISVQSTGTDLFVLTADKNLYKRTTVDDNGQISHKLTHIAFDCPVKKLCSGDLVSLCLLDNGAIMMLCDVNEVINSGGFEIRDCLDIAVFAHNNTYYVQTKQNDEEMEMRLQTKGMTSTWKIIFGQWTCEHFLISKVLGVGPGQLMPGSWPSSFLQRHQSPGQAGGLGDPSGVCLPRFLSDLYGKTLHADLTLQLADGDFPAHRTVLCLTSKYFRDKLTNSPDLTTLDLKIYNPRAYRCLLQHFYQRQPDELDLTSQLDLLLLATNCREDAIAKPVFEQIMRSINAGNIALIRDFAKNSGLMSLEEVFSSLTI